MGYKTTTNKEFKGKGFINGLEFISSDKKDSGASYDIQEVLAKVASEGDEVQFSVKVTDVVETVDEVVGE